ncbi:hypothetical protein M885DRAFT_519835 [Pelagophyceae sp. CCMP2097]|nr:hypothetical protein M885DRAFT_519835 [Pelagophyceae sp. CCMP2097]
MPAPSRGAVSFGHFRRPEGPSEASLRPRLEGPCSLKVQPAAGPASTERSPGPPEGSTQGPQDGGVPALRRTVSRVQGPSWRFLAEEGQSTKAIRTGVRWKRGPLKGAGPRVSRPGSAGL